MPHLNSLNNCPRYFGSLIQGGEKKILTQKYANLQSNFELCVRGGQNGCGLVEFFLPDFLFIQKTFGTRLAGTMAV